MADIEISDDKLLTEELTENDRMTMVSMGTRKFATMKVGRFIAWLAKLMPVASPTSPGLMSAADRQHIGENPFVKTVYISSSIGNKKKLRFKLGTGFSSLKVTVTGNGWYGGGRIEKVFNSQYASVGYNFDSKLAVFSQFPSDAIYVSNVLVLDGSYWLDVVCKNVRFDGIRSLRFVFELTETITATPNEPVTMTSMDATESELTMSNTVEVPW